MIGLLLSDVLANARIWIGILLVTVAAGFIGGLAGSLIQTAANTHNGTDSLFTFAAGLVISFSGVALIIVLNAIAKLTVDLQSRSYALWQLAGVLPSRVTRVVLGQLLVVATLGSLLGCLAALPFLQRVFEYLMSAQSILDGHHIVYSLSPLSGLLVVISTVMIVLLGGIASARRASAVTAITALGGSGLRQTNVGWVRWILVASAVLVASWMLITVASSPAGQVTAPSMVVAPSIVAIIAILGPVSYPLALRLWTAVVPTRVSASWHLARSSAEYRLGVSNAAVGPLLVAVALTGGMYSTAAQTIALAAKQGIFVDANYGLDGFLLVLGGPLLLTATATAAAVFMSSHGREREFALILAAGATRRTVLLTALWEAVSYAVTALLLGSAAILVASICTGLAMGVSLEFAALPVLLVAGGGLCLLVAATVIPTALALRHNIPRTLVIE